MAEFIPQLSSSPKAGRRGISETDRRGLSPTAHSKEEDEVFSPLREFSPLLSSNGGGSVSERETPDGNVFIPSPDLAELKLKASEIEGLLNAKMVILSGGRDKEGQSILTVPARSKEFNFNRDEFRKVVLYLTSLPRDEIRECGFSIIIDGHNSTWTAIKNLLKMFQECLPERIHVAYVVRPTQFLEKRRASTKASKEKLEFSTVVVSSVEKLLHQVAPSQVTTDLGGLLPYDHQKWIKLRLDLEHFISSFNSLMKQFTAFERGLHGDLLAEDPEGAEKMIAHHTSLLQDIRGAPRNVLKEGTDLLVSIEKQQDNFGASNMTPEKIDSVDIIRNLLDRVNRKSQDLEDVWRKRKVVLDQNLQLRYFERSIGKIGGWLKGRSPELFGGKQEIGDSVRASRELFEQFHKSEVKSKDIHDKVTKLRMMADRMCGANHFASEDLKLYIGKLIGRWSRHKDMMDWRKAILEKAIEFHETENKFIVTCDHLTERVQGSFPKISSPQSLSTQVSQLNHDYKTLKGISEEIRAKGDDLAAQMCKVMTEGQPAAEYRKGICHVEEVQYSLKEKMTTFSRLVEARRTSFDQCQQVFKCEENNVKVITWLKELAGQMMSSLGDLGESEEAAAHLEVEHKKFAETAKKTYDGGKNLLSTAMKCRTEYKLDQTPNTKLREELEEVWKGINDGITEREKRLQMSKEFHHVTEEILVEIDEMARPTSPVVAMVGDSNLQGDSLKLRIKQSIDLGERILYSLDQTGVSVFGGEGVPSKISSSASLSMELIRSRIDRLKAVVPDMDNLLLMKEKGKQDAIQLTELEEEIAALRAWFSGEGRVVPSSIIQLDMSRDEFRKSKLVKEREIMEKHKVVEQLKERAHSMASWNQFGNEIVAAVANLQSTWDTCVKEFSRTFDVGDKYISFLELLDKFNKSIERFTVLCGEADDNWQSATPQVLDDLLLLKNSLLNNLDQVCENGEVAIQEMDAIDLVASRPLVEDIKSKIQTIKRRLDQVEVIWIKLESALKNTMELRKLKAEAVTMISEMKEMIHSELNDVRFGDSIAEFEEREEDFGIFEPDCRACLRHSEELKSSIQHLVMLGVAGDSEEECEQVVMEMNAVWSTMKKSLEAVSTGFEEARSVLRKCEKLRQEAESVEQRSPTMSREDRLRHLVTSKDLLEAEFTNWTKSVQKFSKGEQLKGVFTEVCQLADSVVGDFLQQEENLQKVKMLSQDVEKHTEWLENKLRQWLPSNSDLGDNGDEAKELKSRYTNFIASVQPSYKELSNLMTRCRTMCNADPSLQPLVDVHLRRLMESNEVCSETLSERLDVITAFVDFCNTAGKLSFCIGRVDRHCEDIPVIMESGHEGGDMLQQGKEAIQEMNKMAELLSEQGEVFNRRAMTELETTLGPPLAVTGALHRLSNELQGLLRRANTTDRIWQQGVTKVEMNIELSDFRANHMQIVTWLEQQGFPFVMSSIGWRLSEVDGMILEQEEFISKVDRVERDVNLTFAIGNDIIGRSHSHAQEVNFALAELMASFSRFRQLVDVRSRVLNKVCTFYKQAKKLSERISALTLEDRANLSNELTKDLNQLQSSVNGIAVMATELQQVGKPPIAQHLIDIVTDLQRQFLDEDYERGISLESPLTSPPSEDASKSLKPPAPPKRADSFRRYKHIVSRAALSKEELGDEDVDAAKQVRSVATVKKDLLRSEKEYVYMLSILVDQYLCQLGESSHRPDFILERRWAIFGNIEEVYQLHKKILSRLERAKSTDDMCGTFLKMEMELWVYVNYLKTVATGWQTLEKFGGHFFHNVQKEFNLPYSIIECYNVTLTRLKDYLRLFKELHGLTQKEELHSTGIVEQTIVMVTQIDKLCSKIAAFANLVGSPDDLGEDGLLLVEEFQVTRIYKKKKQQQKSLTVFLHESAVVLAQEEYLDTVHPPLYHYQDHIRCSQMMLTETYKGKQRFALSTGPISSADTVLVFQYAEKERILDVKNKWVEVLKNLLMKQLRAMKANTGMGQNILPPPIVHHINIPKDRDRSSRISKRVSEDKAAVDEEERMRSSLRTQLVSSPVAQVTGNASSDVQVYEVCDRYTAHGREELQLPVGQLVEVLDSSSSNWFVCTIASGVGDQPMEGFVPSKYLRKYKSGRPESMVSQYSFTSDFSGDRRSVVEDSEVREDPLLEASLHFLSSRPTSMIHPHNGSNSGGSRPISVVSSVVPKMQQRPISIVSMGVATPPPTSTPEELTWYVLSDFSEGGLYLVKGEAVDVLDSSGPRWCVCTVSDPREGYVPPELLSVTPPTPQFAPQQSMIEATTPTASTPQPLVEKPLPPTLKLQTSVEEPTTPTASIPQPSLGEPLSPTSSMPQPSLGKPLSPTSSSPQPSLGKPLSPTSSMPQPSLGKPLSPTFSMPQPSLGKPLSPTSSTPQPSLGKPLSPTSSTPQPSLGKPLSPTSSTPQPSLGKPLSPTSSTSQPPVKVPVAPAVRESLGGKDSSLYKPSTKPAKDVSHPQDEVRVKQPSPMQGKPAIPPKPSTVPQQSGMGGFLKELQGKFERRQKSRDQKNPGANPTPKSNPIPIPKPNSPPAQPSTAREVNTINKQTSTAKSENVHAKMEETQSKIFEALADFIGDEPSNIPMSVGDLVEVLDDRSVPGWWLVVPVGRGHKKEGWVPAEYLKRADVTPPAGNSPNQRAKTPSSDYGSGAHTPTGLEAQTPGILIVSDPFNKTQPGCTPQEVGGSDKPLVYTSVTHVTAGGPNELTLQLAENVEVLDRSRDDWWLVRTMPTMQVPPTEGWVKATALAPATLTEEVPTPPRGNTRVALADFHPDGPEQISLREGQTLEVVDDSRGDWTLVRTMDSAHLVEGWVPHNYLK